MTDTAEQQWNTMNEQWKATTEAQKHTAATHRGWSKISTGLENELLLKNAAQIFTATAENWASNTRRAARTAHSKHSKRFYALFLRSANSNTAGRRLKQRVGRSTALCLRYVLWLFDYERTHSKQQTAVNMYEQEIRKNCSNCVSR